MRQPVTTEYWKLYHVDNFHPQSELCELSTEDGVSLVDYVRQAVRSQLRDELVVTPCSLTPAAPIHVSFREDGKYLCEGLGQGATIGESLWQGVANALRLWQGCHAGLNELELEPGVQLVDWLGAFEKRPVRDNRRLKLPESDRLGIELTLFHGAEELTDRSHSAISQAISLGVHGLALECAGRCAWFSSSKPIIHNYSATKTCERLAESIGLSSDGYRRADARLWRLETIHLVQPSRATPPRRLFRCDRTIPREQTDFGSVQQLLDGAGKWLLRHVRGDGSLEYKYLPSRGEYSSANNDLRQWMATHCLAELHRDAPDQRHQEAYQRNLAYNLAKYYRNTGAFAYIIDQDKAKLGAAACALMALLAGDNGEKYASEAASLKHGLLSQSEPDGSFRTFFVPSDRNDQQSFYSGEAMLALAMWLERRPDPALQERLRHAREYYLPYYRATGRYAPFIPWHTMAYWRLAKLTGDDDYTKAIFELNDWLVCLQNVDPASPLDQQGDFFVSRFAYNGPSHASSTAVYLEGLAYAYAAARAAGDETRAAAYCSSLRWGWRYLIQLQFREENAFYLRHRQRVLGGLRTTLADNQVRCDNVQHAAMAAMALLTQVPKAAFSTAGDEVRGYRDRMLERFTARPTARKSTSGAGRISRMLLAGDAQLGRFTERWAERLGTAHALAAIRPVLDEADGLICNLECVVAESGSPVAKQGDRVWHLRASPTMLDVFPSDRVTCVSVANNHAMDYGPDALMEMLTRHLPGRGVFYAGAGETAMSAQRPAKFQLGAHSASLHAVTTIEPEFRATETLPGYCFVSEKLSDFQRHLDKLIATDDSSSTIRLLAIHWGRNHESRVPPEHVAMAHAAIDAGFHAVIGHHAHVNRAIEMYRDCPIFYDLGNFLCDFKFLSWDDRSVMAMLSFDERGVAGIELIPILLHDKAVAPAVGDTAVAILKRLAALSSSFGTRLEIHNGRAHIICRTVREHLP